ncbi:nuclear transport factor 2 family protein [Microbacterium sp. DT81.1]|uniref:nuclear transport factor 2 family protein n=1 Tax=Microbacterium sp. DT81.1 TaxID=3393413 RepID=UPI003CEAAE95
MDTPTLLRHMLLDVFGDRDISRGLGVADRIFAPDVSFSDRDGTVVGVPALMEKVARIQAESPGFEFAIAAGPYESGDIGYLEWTYGPTGQSIVDGRDIVIVRDGRIAEIHTFVLPPRPESARP